MEFDIIFERPYTYASCDGVVGVACCSNEPFDRVKGALVAAMRWGLSPQTEHECIPPMPKGGDQDVVLSIPTKIYQATLRDAAKAIGGHRALFGFNFSSTIIENGTQGFTFAFAQKGDISDVEREIDLASKYKELDRLTQQLETVELLAELVEKVEEVETTNEMHLALLEQKDETIGRLQDQKYAMGRLLAKHVDPEDIPQMLSPKEATLFKIACKEGRKIDAIKTVRQNTGIGIKEAKDITERYIAYQDVNEIIFTSRYNVDYTRVALKNAFKSRPGAWTMLLPPETVKLIDSYRVKDLGKAISVVQKHTGLTYNDACEVLHARNKHYGDER